MLSECFKNQVSISDLYGIWLIWKLMFCFNWDRYERKLQLSSFKLHTISLTKLMSSHWCLPALAILDCHLTTEFLTLFRELASVKFPSLQHYMLEELNFNFRYVGLCDSDIPREKWLYCLQAVDTLIRCHRMRHLTWVSTVYQLPFWESPD